MLTSTYIYMNVRSLVLWDDQTWSQDAWMQEQS